MHLESLRIAFGALGKWCQFHVDVRGNQIYYSMYKWWDSRLLRYSLDNLDWVSGFKQACDDDDIEDIEGGYRCGVFRGDASLWLSIFHEIHVERWEKEYKENRKKITCGKGSFRSKCKFTEMDEWLCSQGYHEMPDDLLSYLIPILDWLDEPGPQLVDEKLTALRASLREA